MLLAHELAKFQGLVGGAAPSIQGCGSNFFCTHVKGVKRRDSIAYSHAWLLYEKIVVGASLILPGHKHNSSRRKA